MWGLASVLPESFSFLQLPSSGYLDGPSRPDNFFAAVEISDQFHLSGWPEREIDAFFLLRTVFRPGKPIFFLFPFEVFRVISFFPNQDLGCPRLFATLSNFSILYLNGYTPLCLPLTL